MNPLVLALALTGPASTPPPPDPFQIDRIGQTVAADTPFTLSDALARARRTSPRRAAATQRVEATTRAERLVTRLPNPIVEFSRENFGAAAPARLPIDTFAVVSQGIELGGKAGARRREARALIAAAQADAALTGRELDAEVAARYIEAVRERSHVRSLTSQRNGIVELVHILLRRTAEGHTAEADLRKFESEQARVELQIVRAEAALQEQLTRLGALLGDAVPASRLVPPSVDPRVLRPPESLTETEVDLRAEVTAARARVARAQALLGLERARGIPDLMVSAGYKRTSGFDTGVLAVSVPVPLFDRNRTAVAQAAGDARAAELEFAFTRAQALAEARALWASAGRLTDQAERAEPTLLAPAAIVRTAARSAFEQGGGDVLRLVDAERVYAEARRDTVDVRLDAVLAVIAARLALGEEPWP